jgi:prevent-host-death family protein
MIQVEALEAEAIFEQLIDAVERGEEIVITRERRPVAKLVPFRAESEASSSADK